MIMGGLFGYLHLSNLFFCFDYLCLITPLGRIHDVVLLLLLVVFLVVLLELLGNSSLIVGNSYQNDVVGPLGVPFLVNIPKVLFDSLFTTPNRGWIEILRRWAIALGLAYVNCILSLVLVNFRSFFSNLNYENN